MANLSLAPPGQRRGYVAATRPTSSIASVTCTAASPAVPGRGGVAATGMSEPTAIPHTTADHHLYGDNAIIRVVDAHKRARPANAPYPAVVKKSEAKAEAAAPEAAAETTEQKAE